jgi:uncharacterized damage-inducible protein DinB
MGKYMTNKEFFMKTLEEEAPKFRSVIEALPEDKFDYKVHDRSRSAGSLASQLARQWEGVSGVVIKGEPTMDAHSEKQTSKKDLLTTFDKGIEQLKKDVMKISDDAWENDMAKMEFPGGTWEDKKYNMAWGFLFDGIHHRGQLSTYLRAMGAKVPSVYGNSADTK